MNVIIRFNSSSNVSLFYSERCTPRATVAAMSNWATLHHLCERITPPPHMWLLLLSPPLFRSPLECCWGLCSPEQRGLFEAFLAALNGTMVAAHRADSCFIEPVYNVCWMEHINRLTLTSLPPPRIGEGEKWKRKKLLSHWATMTAFSTSVICQPLLALRRTKEMAVEERGRRGGTWVFYIIISGAA